MRLFLLGTHYRNPIQLLGRDPRRGGAAARLPLRDASRRRTGSARRRRRPGRAAPFVEEARRALDDDFNTPQVLGILAEAFTAANALADRKGKKTPEDKAALAGFARDVRAVGATLGLLQRRPAEALRALRAHAAARRGIDRAWWRASSRSAPPPGRRRTSPGADAIRDELLATGVAIMDGPEGTTWKVV